jgi:hypothetical protein
VVETTPDWLTGRWVRRAAVAVARRPSLWGTALTQTFRLAEPGWWRRRPHLPVPSADYLRFRLQTQYGDPSREPEPEDLLTYLHWVRASGL